MLFETIHEMCFIMIDKAEKQITLDLYDWHMVYKIK